MKHKPALTCSVSSTPDSLEGREADDLKNFPESEIYCLASKEMTRSYVHLLICWSVAKVTIPFSDDQLFAGKNSTPPPTFAKS